MKDVQGDKIWYRIKVLFAILAVNQNQPNIAVEILSAQMLTKENLNVYVSRLKIGPLKMTMTSWLILL